MGSMGWVLGGKVALVTGAATRLGRAMAEGLATLGCDVAVHYAGNEAGAREACDVIAANGNRVGRFQADLTAAEACGSLVAAVEAELGPVSILVNSAALFERADILETPLEVLDRLWALNTRAPFLLSQAVGRGMVARGSGDIINLLDIGGVHQTWRHYGAYNLTKAATYSLTKSLALELAPAVRVNAIAPGTVLAPENLPPETLETLKAAIPQKRFGSPADVVETLKYLVTGPKFITGQVIAVDGGRSLGAL